MVDLVEGGSIYSVDGGPTAGSISTGDALAAIAYAVFDEKVLTMAQLLHACETNHEDMTTTPTGPQIQAMMRNKAPKYGNDDDTADRWTVAVENSSARRCVMNIELQAWHGKGPVPCCFSTARARSAATSPSAAASAPPRRGRKTAPRSTTVFLRPMAAERNGATAATMSVSKLPTQWIQKGAIFNMRLLKSALDSRERSNGSAV